MPKQMLTLILLFYSFFLYSNETEELFFLMGKFEPQKHPEFVSLKSLGIPTKQKELFLQKDAALQLQKMYLAFRKEHPHIPFWITSATRSYWHQKTIWESKWQKNQNRSEEEKVKEILRFSSMPGASRHHWGTDVDVNVLENSYYETQEGKILFDWLKQNAKRFGFCMPYSENRNQGHEVEKWHWSYFPLAKNYQKKWNEYFQKGAMQKHLDFSGSEYFPKYAAEYINSINPECF
ncbi:MAG: M15 family metallopeptidase [Leptospiraceae bacterium]|nr:M15 family metallopeptidase [Leptospiraceae bacterium]MDW7975070.1 M15 family metallopeptidase [Leptospiraceae bacterium]